MSTDRPAAVDAHHHLWDLTAHRHDWLDEPGREVIRRSFGPADLREAVAGGVAGRPVTATVLVQALPDPGETEALLALAAGEPLVGAVVGWVDLTAPDVGDRLDALRSAPGGERLRGVRHLVESEPDPRWLARPQVRAGLAAVAARDLTYDLLVRPAQLPAAVELAAALPDLTLVLDHAGKPGIAGGDLAGWERDLRALARHEQVRCKLSGLVTEADHARWRPADLAPVTQVLLDAFGPARLMFGSDWPVCLLASSWPRWARTAADLLAGLTRAELNEVLSGTATATYRLAGS